MVSDELDSVGDQGPVPDSLVDLVPSARLVGGPMTLRSAGLVRLSDC